jgi:hypothetical protein
MWVNRYWRALLKSPMRTMGVVVVLVLGQDLDELALVEDQHPVQALAADGADPPLGVGVTLRCTGRATQDCDAGIGEHSIEARGELRVAIADQKPEAVDPVRQHEHKVTGLLSDPLPRRMTRHSEDVNPASPDLEDEEHLHPPQQHRVDGEEVTRQHRRGLGTAEVPPRRADSPWRGVETRLLQDVPDRR